MLLVVWLVSKECQQTPPIFLPTGVLTYICIHVCMYVCTRVYSMTHAPPPVRTWYVQEGAPHTCNYA